MLLPSPSAGLDDVNASPLPPVASELLPPTRSAIERFASRRARLQLCRGIAVGIFCLIAGMLLLVAIDYFWSMSTLLRTIGTVLVDMAALMTAWWCGVRQSRRRDWTAIARSMEAATPPLRERLLAAVELEDPRSANGSIEFRSSLQSGVAGELSSIDIRHMLPWRLVRTALVTAILAGLTVALLSLIPSLQLPRRLARALVPLAPIERASITQLRIIAPRPPSKSVAHGDLIAIVAAVEKLGSGDVHLQWQSEDGRVGELSMSPRGVLSTAGATNEATGDVNVSQSEAAEPYAVNLQVDRSAVHYRVLAGDAESRWHTLTPMPRPRVVEFAKRYRFPSYAKLPDAESRDEHGDVEALVGTTAEVTVTFDQPVVSPQVWFGDYGNDVAVPMHSVEGDPTRFRFDVAIQTPGSYRVDAISMQSELDNPFLPRCLIDPVVDQPPTSMWSGTVQTRQLASSAAVLSFPGRIEDDLPMDHYVIESIVDAGPIRERVVQLDPVDTQQDILWNADLMDLSGTGTQSEALPAGTLLRVRLVALDRQGKRGESDWRYIFIAGEQFDPNRHAALYAWQTLAGEMSTWLMDLQGVLESIKKSTEQAKEDLDGDGFVPDRELNAALGALSERWHEIAGDMDPDVLRELAKDRDSDEVVLEPRSLSEMMLRSTDSVSTDQQSLLDRFAMTALMRLHGSLASWQHAAELGDAMDEQSRKRVVDEVAATVRQIQGRIKQTRELPKQLLASKLAKALIDDLESIRAQTALLVDEGTVSEESVNRDSAIPMERLPGQANLLSERIRLVDVLIGSLEDDLPDETQRHLQNLRSFLGESIFRIEQANEKLQLDRNPDVERNFRDSLAQLLLDMQQHQTGSVVHGNTFNKIAGAVRELSRADLQSHAAIDTLGRDGREWQASIERLHRAQEQQDSVKIAPSVAHEQLRHDAFTAQRDGLVKQYQRAEARERIRPDMQVSVASDFKLIRQVMEIITEAGFAPIADERPNVVFDRVARAATVLEAGGQLTRLAAQLQDIADRERFGDDSADQAIDQGIRLEHYQVFSETPLQQLRSAELDHQLIDDLQATRWGWEFNQARDWITKRRYDSQPTVSAAAPVQSLATRYRDAMPAIDAAMVEARATLRAFLPTTSELAEAAAAEAKKQQTNSPPQSSQGEPSSETEESERSIDELQERVNRLADDLVDRANEANLSDVDERELARDADAALQKIQRQMNAVAAAMKQPENAASPAQATQNLEKLAETLQTTAAHFAAAQTGEGLSQTRQELREDMQPSSLEDSLQDASATSDLAQTSPEELLKQLERQLQRDLPMQANLSEISQRTVADVGKAVRAAAEQEDRLQRELEKADPQLDEQKRRLRNQLRSLTDQSRAVNDQWLAAVERASSRVEDEAALKTVRELREELRSSVDQADRVQHQESLLEEIQSASRQLQETLQHAAEKSQELEQAAMRDTADAIHPSKKSRDQRASQLEAEQRRTQNDWIKSLGRQVPWWRQRREEAGRRVQQAEQQKRDAEKQLSQAETQLRDQPDQPGLQEKVRETRQRVEEASRATAAAEATQEAAGQAEQRAVAFNDQTKKQSMSKLEMNNPTAGLLAQTSEISQREMTRLAASLDQLIQESAPDEVSKPRRSSAQWMAKSQAETRQATRQAADDLSRAARHEDRLGNAGAANQLEAAANELHKTAESSLQKAERGLQQAADSDPTDSGDDSTASAHQSLGRAAEQLAAQADTLSAMAKSATGAELPTGASETMPPAPNNPTSTGTLAEADRPEKLARALDELDRALFGSSADRTTATDASNASKSTAGDPSAGDFSAGKSTGGESTGGKSTGGTGQTAAGENPSAASQPVQSPATASEASPTLAAAAQQAARRLAAERQQRLNQIASAGEPGSDQGQQSQNQADNPGSQSGGLFEMPAGGLLDMDGGLRTDGQWGALREKTSDDMIQDRKASVPLPYRGAIEAYFQTIAGEAARARSGAPESLDHAGEETK